MAHWALSAWQIYVSPTSTAVWVGLEMSLISKYCKIVCFVDLMAAMSSPELYEGWWLAWWLLILAGNVSDTKLEGFSSLLEGDQFSLQQFKTKAI